MIPSRLVRKTVRLALGAALGVSILAGCTFATDPNDGSPALDDTEQTASDAANDLASALEGMQDDLAGMLGDIHDSANEADAVSDLGKAERITLTDARTGEIVAVCEDANAIASLVSSFDLPSWRSAEEPSEAAEYTASFQQRATAKLGENVEDVENIELCTLTTYEGSDVIALSTGSTTLHVHVPATDATALRSLAQ